MFPIFYDFNNLHPTMYLLIRRFVHIICTLLLYLHPTMYLLILVGDTDYDGTPINLHPTMYLLIRQEVINLKTDCIIYIPLCIY